MSRGLGKARDEADIALEGMRPVVEELHDADHLVAHHDRESQRNLVAPGPQTLSESRVEIVVTV